MFVEQCCDKGGATLVGSVDASLSPGADRDGQRHVGAAFGLVVSPAWALCLAVCAFRAILGAQAGQCSRRVCVFPRRWAFDETYWRCGIRLANMARRGMCSIDNLLHVAICKKTTVKKHRCLQQNPDQKYGDILEILVIDCESNFEALWLSCDQNANKKKMLHQ